MAVQPVSNSAKTAPVQAMSCQFFQENAMGDSVKGFAEGQADNIHSLSVIPQVDHLDHTVIKGDQVGQAGPVPPISVLAGPDPRLSCVCRVTVLKIICSMTFSVTHFRLIGL